MAKSTTGHGDTPAVRGEPHQQPAVRRLARACIALVRWQRGGSVVPTTENTEPTAGPAAETGHD
ncbi:hypothetical protein GCM10023321_37740 [Pseudonocardia eucalypti]|uniref:Uncharacterized protein n=1 Tax=Pseudonocardia eucalypti TaxID=648755 RepID=A0ABP9Q8J0_9PSEU|nr:hypothetical protein [Pseudonocardia eucalypti]